MQWDFMRERHKQLEKEGWLRQFVADEAQAKDAVEIYGGEDVEIEEVNSAVFKCFEEGGEKIYRIWSRIREEEQI